MRRTLAVIGIAAAAALTLVVPATAAPAATPSAPLPVGVHAPKGMPPIPGAPSRVHANGTFPPTSFLYSDAAQFVTANGTSTDITVEQPVVGPADFHSLAETAAQSADQQQIVEIGWSVDHTTYGDGLPHLFAFHWVDDNPTCGDSCGWVPYARAPWVAGQVLPVGATMNFKIEHVTTGTPTGQPGWQLSLNNIPFGEFPDTDWAGRNFTQIGLAQWFGEVAASASQPPCTQMGDGEFASSPTAAQFTNISLINGPTVNFSSTGATNPAFYTMNQTSSNSFRFGGPGSGC